MSNLFIEHVYHNRLLPEELDEIMVDTYLRDITPDAREVILNYLYFCTEVMSGIINNPCVLNFECTDKIIVSQLIVSNPLNDEILLIAEMCHNVNTTVTAITELFTRIQFVNVFSTVNKQNTSVLNTIPYASIRDNVYKYMQKMMSSHPQTDQVFKPYLHLNNISDGALKVVNVFEVDDGKIPMSVTIQINMPTVSPHDITVEQLQEAREALIN